MQYSFIMGVSHIISQHNQTQHPATATAHAEKIK